MNANESLQYLAAVAQDFARTLPPSAQGPYTMTVNEALQTLSRLVATPDTAAMLDAHPPTANGDGRRRTDGYGEEGEQRKAPASFDRGPLD